MRITKSVRILGIDDASFNNNDKIVKVVGTIFRGINLIEGFLIFDIEKDGLDITENLIDAIKKSKFAEQISVVISKGVTFAGFNILDIKEFYEKTKIPYIVVMRKNPDFVKIKNALNKIDNSHDRFKKLQNAGLIRKYGNILYQSIGLEDKDVEFILKLSIKHANIPEPIRISHLIGSAITFGESRGQV